MMESKSLKIQDLTKTIEDLRNQLRKGTTPQIEGLNLEEELAKELGERFRGDKVQRFGKKGDILQTVMYRRQCARRVLSESTRKGPISRRHIDLETWVNEHEGEALRIYERATVALVSPTLDDDSDVEYITIKRDPSGWLNLSRGGGLLLVRLEGRVIGYCPAETVQNLLSGVVRAIPIISTFA